MELRCGAGVWQRAHVGLRIPSSKLRILRDRMSSSHLSDALVSEQRPFLSRMAKKEKNPRARGRPAEPQAERLCLTQEVLRLVHGPP